MNARLDFRRLLDAKQPIIGLYWELCSAVLRVFENSGWLVLVDVSRNSVCRHRHIAALKDAEQIEWSPCRRYGAILGAGRLSVWNVLKDCVVSPPDTAGAVEHISWRPNPPCSEGELWLAGTLGLAAWAAEGSFSLHTAEAKGNVSAMAWNPTGTCLAEAWKHGSVQVWNVPANRRIRMEHCDESPIWRFAWNSTGVLLAGISTNRLLVWNIPAAFHGRTGVRFVHCEDAPVSSLVFRPQSNILAAGGIDGCVKTLRVVVENGVLASARLDGAITHLAWMPSGKQLAVATSGGEVFWARICR